MAITTHGTDGGMYQGARWSLRWTGDNDTGVHTVRLTENGESRVVYQGTYYNDASDAFIAQQGVHFDDGAERKRRGGI